MKTKIFLIIFCILIFLNTVLLSEDSSVENVVIAKDVKNGFVFYDGKYIEMPYNISRKEKGIYINDCKLFYPFEMFFPSLFSNVKIKINDKGDPIMPDIPLSKDITFEDFIAYDYPWADHLSKKFDYIWGNASDEKKARDDIISFMKTFPFIKDVNENKKSKDDIVIITYKDKKPIHLDISRSNNENIQTPKTKEELYIKIDQDIKDNLIKYLEKGECVFIFSDNPMRVSMSADRAINDLPEIVEVLKSRKTSEEKADGLYKLRLVLDKEGKNTLTIIKNFKANEQLDQRIQSIMNWRKNNNYVRKEVEKMPTAEEEEKALQEFIKAQGKK